MQKNIIKNKKYNIVDFLAIYLLLFLAVGFPLSIFNGKIQLTFLVTLCFVTFLCKYKSIKNLNLNFNIAIVVLFLFFIVLISALINNEGLKQVIIFTIILLCVYFFINIYSLSKFLYIFKNIMIYLCLFSLITIIIYWIFPKFIEMFPIVENSCGRKAYNLIFAFIGKSWNTELARNQSIFWEPGAMPFFAVIALLTILFNEKEKNKIIKIIIIISALITTFSTTAYIITIAFLLLCLMQYYYKNKSFQKRIIIFFCAIILICLIITIYFILPKSVQYQILGKVIDFKLNKEIDTSTGVRYYAMIEPFKVMLKNPLFGIGPIKLGLYAIKIGYLMNTCTISYWFGAYGIIFGTIMVIGIYSFASIFKTNKFINFCAFIIICLTILPENYYRNEILLIIILYGLDILFKREKNLKEVNYENSCN